MSFSHATATIIPSSTASTSALRKARPRGELYGTYRQHQLGLREQQLHHQPLYLFFRPFSIPSPPPEGAPPDEPRPDPFVCKPSDYKVPPNDPKEKPKRFEDAYKAKGCWKDVHADSVNGAIKTSTPGIPNGDEGRIVHSTIRNRSKILQRRQWPQGYHVYD